MTPQDKLLLRYFKMKFKEYDYDFRISSDGNQHQLHLYVDCAKMDKNTSSYDENYRNSLYKPRKKGQGFYIYSPSGKFEAQITSAKKLIPIISNDYRFFFNFKNYEYLDDIEKRINEILNESDAGYCGFKADWDNPVVKIEFRNTKFRQSEHFDYNLQKLNELISPHNITLESYIVAFVYGR